MCLVLLELTADTHVPFLLVNDNDNEWVNEDEADIDLEEDTDIEKGEVDDLKENMASRCTPTRTPKKAVKAKTTNNIARLGRTSLKDHGTNFSQSFARLHFTFREGAKDLAIYEVLAIDQSLLRHVKVLPGGQKLSIMFEYPQKLASKRASRMILDRLGTEYNPNHIPVQSGSSQVGHYINSNFKEHKDQLEGDPQIIKLPFKCIEWAHSGNNAMWMKRRKKGGDLDFNNCHHEHFSTQLVRVESSHTYAVESTQDVEHVLDDSDASSVDRVDGDEDPML